MQSFQNESSHTYNALTKPFILASASPHRLRLLKNAGLTPSMIVPANIDESEQKKETPRHYVLRIALQKALCVAKRHPYICILSADTIIVAKGHIIRKAKNEKEAKNNLMLLSKAPHYVLTGYCIIDSHGHIINRVVKSVVFMKKLTSCEIDILIRSGEWKNVAGYSIEGKLSAFVKKTQGSYPNIVGLPIYEIAQDFKKIFQY